MAAADRIQKRLDDTLRMLAIHQAHGRGLDAAVCAVRAQALREALADARGEKMPAMRLYHSRQKD